MKAFIVNASKFLKETFNNNQVISAASIFDVHLWPQDPDALTFYGDSEISVLAEQFKPALENAQLDSVAAENEWHDLKAMLTRRIQYELQVLQLPGIRYLGEPAIDVERHEAM